MSILKHGFLSYLCLQDRIDGNDPFLIMTKLSLILDGTLRF